MSRTIPEYFKYKIDENILKSLDPKKYTYEIGKVGLDGEKTKDRKYVKNTATRKSKIKWIYDESILKNIKYIINYLNVQSLWNFKLTLLDNLQYTIYNVGDYYNWHRDDNPIYNKDKRKISFSIGLNDPNEYEGGELDIEIHGPNIKGKRFETIVLEKNEMICFKSSLWHRVRPVTKGVRKSLVGWVRGPQFV
ncbi:MAG: 2OG-Fe(II) oxygenase [Candidatus Actinomarina sp.]